MPLDRRWVRNRPRRVEERVARRDASGQPSQRGGLSDRRLESMEAALPGDRLQQHVADRAGAERRKCRVARTDAAEHRGESLARVPLEVDHLAREHQLERPDLQRERSHDAEGLAHLRAQVLDVRADRVVAGVVEQEAASRAGDRAHGGVDGPASGGPAELGLFGQLGGKGRRRSRLLGHGPLALPES